MELADLPGKKPFRAWWADPATNPNLAQNGPETMRDYLILAKPTRKEPTMSDIQQATQQAVQQAFQQQAAAEEVKRQAAAREQALEARLAKLEQSTQSAPSRNDAADDPNIVMVGQHRVCKSCLEKDHRELLERAAKDRDFIIASADGLGLLPRKIVVEDGRP